MRLGRQTAFRIADLKAGPVVVLLMAILVLVAAVRIRLLNMPLERDEGEFAYGAQMLLQGLSPYKHAYDVTLKLPGTCGVYALAMALFGQTTAAVHAALILVTLATALLVFLLTRRICGEPAGLVAAATYALLSISPPSFALAAHATHFVMLPALAGIFLLQPLNERTSLKRIFSAGLLLGLAILMKQTGAAFGLFAALWVVHCERCSTEKSHARLFKRLGVLAAGGFLPFTVTCCIIALSGDWAQFLLWTVKFAGAHEALLTFARGTEIAAGMALKLFKGAPALWCFALIGLFVFWRESNLRRWRFFILSFAVFSLLAVYPGWREHYFIQFFPAAGVLAGATFRAASALSERRKAPLATLTLPGLVFCAICAATLIQWRAVYFTESPAQASRTVYGVNPFPEAVEVGDYLAAHCPKDGTIAVLGSEAEIYFYANRRAATGHICTYPIMEPQPYALSMQKQMIQEIEQNAPDYVVFVNVSTSWLQRPKSETLILDWFKQYRREHLQMVGLIAITPEATGYRWLNDNEPPVGTSVESWLAVYKTRTAD